MALKPEPIDVDEEDPHTFLNNNNNNNNSSSNGGSTSVASSLRASSTQHDDAVKHMTSVNATSHPVNFLTGHSGSGVVLDPLQEDVVFMPRHVPGSREYRRGLGGAREVTEYANYTISHHEAELNSKQLPKKYRCRFCIYKTSYKSDLNRHLRKHGIAPQHCPLCNMPFKTSGNLENHIRQAHTDVAESMGIMPSSLSTMCLEGVLVPPPLSLGGMVSFPLTTAEVQVPPVPEQGQPHLPHPHPHPRHLQHEFPALSHAVLSPAQLSCHVCSFVSSDSQILARHILTHPGEEETSRAPKCSPSDVTITRLACNFCGVILSSIDELQSHRHSCLSPEDLSTKARTKTGTDERADEEGYHDNETVLKVTDDNGEGSWQDRMTSPNRTGADQKEAQDCVGSQPVQSQTSRANSEKEHMTLPHITVVDTDSQSTERRPADPVARSRVLNVMHKSDVNRGESPQVTPAAGDPNKLTTRQNRTADDDVITGPLLNGLISVDSDKDVSSMATDQEDVSETTELSDDQFKGTTRTSLRQREPDDDFGRCVQLSKPGLKTASKSSEIRDPKVCGETSSNTPSQLDYIDYTHMPPSHATQDKDCPNTEHTSTGKLHPSNKVTDPLSGSVTSKQPVSQRVLHHPHVNARDAQRPNLIKDKSNTVDNEGESVQISRRLLPQYSEKRRLGLPPGLHSVRAGRRECVLCGHLFRNRTRLTTHLRLVHALSTSSVGRRMESNTRIDSHTTTLQENGQQSSVSVRDSGRRGVKTHRLGVPASASLTSLPAREFPSAQVLSYTRTCSSVSTYDADRHSQSSLASHEQGAPGRTSTRSRDARVVSQPPSSGRYARLVSDFEEFSSRPYACSLCFFRTSRLSELSVHVDNHLTGCSSTPVPDTARLQARQSLYVERATSPCRPDSPYLLSLSPPSSVSGVSSDSPMDTAEEAARGDVGDHPESRSQDVDDHPESRSQDVDDHPESRSQDVGDHHESHCQDMSDNRISPCRNVGHRESPCRNVGHRESHCQDVGYHNDSPCRDVGDRESHCHDVGHRESHCQDVGHSEPHCQDVGHQESHCQDVGHRESHCQDVRDHHKSHCRDVGEHESHCQDVGYHRESHCQNVGEHESHCQNVGEHESHCQDMGHRESHCQDVGHRESHCQDMGHRESPCQDVGHRESHCQDMGHRESHCQDVGHQESHCQDVGHRESHCQDVGHRKSHCQDVSVRPDSASARVHRGPSLLHELSDHVKIVDRSPFQGLPQTTVKEEEEEEEDKKMSAMCGPASLSSTPTDPSKTTINTQCSDASPTTCSSNRRTLSAADLPLVISGQGEPSVSTTEELSDDTVPTTMDEHDTHGIEDDGSIVPITMNEHDTHGLDNDSSTVPITMNEHDTHGIDNDSSTVPITMNEHDTHGLDNDSSTVPITMNEHDTHVTEGDDTVPITMNEHVTEGDDTIPITMNEHGTEGDVTVPITMNEHVTEGDDTIPITMNEHDTHGTEGDDTVPITMDEHDAHDIEGHYSIVPITMDEHDTHGIEGDDTVPITMNEHDTHGLEGDDSSTVPITMNEHDLRGIEGDDTVPITMNEHDTHGLEGDDSSTVPITMNGHDTHGIEGLSSTVPITMDEHDTYGLEGDGTVPITMDEHDTHDLQGDDTVPITMGEHDTHGTEGDDTVPITMNEHDPHGIEGDDTVPITMDENDTHGLEGDDTVPITMNEHDTHGIEDNSIIVPITMDKHDTHSLEGDDTVPITMNEHDTHGIGGDDTVPVTMNEHGTHGLDNDSSTVPITMNEHDTHGLEGDDTVHITMNEHGVEGYDTVPITMNEHDTHDIEGHCSTVPITMDEHDRHGLADDSSKTNARVGNRDNHDNDSAQSQVIPEPVKVANTNGTDAIQPEMAVHAQERLFHKGGMIQQLKASPDTVVDRLRNVSTTFPAGDSQKTADGISPLRDLSPVTSVRSSPVTSLRSSPVTSLSSHVTSLRGSPVTSLRGSPVTSFRSSPVTSLRRSPVTSLRSSPVTSLRGFPVTSLRDSPVTSLRGSPVTSLRNSPVTSLRGSPVTSLRGSPVTSQSSAVTSLRSSPVTSLRSSGGKETENHLTRRPQLLHAARSRRKLGAVVRHVRWTHQPRKPYWALSGSQKSICVKCEKTFSLRPLLIRHLRIIHSVSAGKKTK